MNVLQPSTQVINTIEDSRRWKLVTLRPDDIIVSTPAKSGTTWTQGIVRTLLWPDDNAPGPLGAMQVWPDARFEPGEEMGRRAEAPTYRRFLKSHTSAPARPWSDQVSYIVTYRNPADALVSWGNHRADMKADVFRALNADAEASGVATLPETWDGDYHYLLGEWLEQEMRRIADFLGSASFGVSSTAGVARTPNIRNRAGRVASRTTKATDRR